MSSKRPQPVRAASVQTAVVTFATATVGLAVSFGLDLTAGQQQQVLAAAVSLTATAAALWSLFSGDLAAEKVTPLSDPQDAEGNRLTPEGE